MTTDPRWNEIFAKQGWGRWPNTRFVEWAMRRFGDRSLVERGQTRFLELGCGYGAQLRFLEAEGFTVTGIDAAPQAISFCNGCGYTVERIDMTEFEAPEATYDCVFDVCALQHLSWEEAQAVTSNAYRWLKPGGAFFSMHVGHYSTGPDDTSVPAPRLLEEAQLPKLFRDYRGMETSYEIVINRRRDGFAKSERRHWIIEANKEP